MGANVWQQSATAVTKSGDSGSLEIGPLVSVAVDLDVTSVSGTTPSMVVHLDRKGAGGGWFSAWSSTPITSTGVTSASIGPGCATAEVLSSSIRLRWVITGTTPSFTFAGSVVGR